MNPDIYRTVGIRVLVVAFGACLAWFLVVKPRADRASSLDVAFVSQRSMIEQYESYRQTNQDSSESGTAEVLARARGLISDTISENDPGTMLHALLNEHADSQGVRISSIDNLQAKEIKSKIADSFEQVLGDRALVRVEFQGAFANVTRFMHEIVNTSVPVKLTGFRLIPIGTDAVRVNAEIEIVTLNQVPGIRSDTTPEQTDDEKGES